ncbi:hypothetical protein DM860_011625 [Cuscuta australis]|uniref:Presenilin n=1 Tax=Cuscuta australis TaxID=267555 RepID=A0A328D430_9ASTE|nr:hypothetical protein DM860_011625 [Cuscuta australis]
MPQITRRTTILDSLGEEIVRIIIPVSICMFFVVLLVSVLNTDPDPSPPPLTTIATAAYSESSSDTAWDKLKGALLNALIFIAVVTVVTFILLLMFYYRLTSFLKYYMGFSSFLVLAIMGGEISLFLIKDLSFPIDFVTFSLVLYNFTVVGVLAVFMSKMAILVTQGYLVIIGMLVAYWFTLLPEWTTWVLLIAMALYDLAAVLLPVGPLRLLVELAISRDEDIPALVYEARPVINPHSIPRGTVLQRRVWRERPATESNPNSDSTLGSSPINRNDDNETITIARDDSELAVPLIQHIVNVDLNSQEGPCDGLAPEGVGLGSSGAIKLGLGDFIFYSVLVGRAAMYDFMTVYACYLTIIAGLVITLMLLAFYQKALPALPVSVMLGVVFYFLTRFLLEAFVVQCSMNLLMF